MLKKRWHALLGGVLLILVAASGGGFASTLTGATGMIMVPTASVLPTGAGEVSLHATDGRTGFSASYGIFENVEVAVNTLKPGNSPVDLGIVFKGLVFSETAERPGLAVGFESTQSYIMASKRLTPRMRVHVGYGDGDLKGAVGGVSYTLSSAAVSGGTPPTTLMAEYVDKEINVGARMVFSPQLSLDLALLNLKRLSAGVSVRVSF